MSATTLRTQIMSLPERSINGIDDLLSQNAKEGKIGEHEYRTVRLIIYDSFSKEMFLVALLILMVVLGIGLSPSFNSDVVGLQITSGLSLSITAVALPILFYQYRKIMNEELTEEQIDKVVDHLKTKYESEVASLSSRLEKLQVHAQEFGKPPIS